MNMVMIDEFNVVVEHQIGGNNLISPWEDGIDGEEDEGDYFAVLQLDNKYYLYIYDHVGRRI